MNNVLETNQTHPIPYIQTMDYHYQSPEGRTILVKNVPIKTHIDQYGTSHQVFSSDVAQVLYDLIGLALANNSQNQETVEYLNT